MKEVAMRVFEKDCKINFVDTNDVFVGFDSGQYCCESFGYNFALSSEQGADEVPAPSNLEAMIFDVEYFVEHEADYQQAVVFRLTHPIRVGNDAGMRAAERQLAADGGHAEIFLVLYNHHNGYYGHGFSMEHGGTVVQSGGI